MKLNSSNLLDNKVRRSARFNYLPDFDKEANSFTMYKDKFEMIHSFFSTK